MTYFNGGGGYYWLGEYVPLEPCTAIYCDDCAETEIPLPRIPAGTPGESPFGTKLRAGNRHHGTGFKWTFFFGGSAACKKCGKPA